MSARSPRKKATGKSMSSVEASRAKTSAMPGKGPGLPVQGPVFGSSSLGSLASFDLDTLSWRTSQRCLLEGWVRFSGRWPRSGMTRSGTLSQLRPLVRRTGGTASGLWLSTPTAAMSVRGERFRRDVMTPAEFVQQFPTPPAAMVKTSGLTREAAEREFQRSVERGGSPSCLSVAVLGGGQMWPTPRAEDSQSCGAHRGVPDSLTSAVRMWPTPTAAGFDCADVPRLLQRREEVKAKGINGNGFGLTLGQAVKVAMWPTPDASMGTGGRVSKEPPVGKRKSGAKKSITLNDAVKWEMWPTPNTVDAKGGTRNGEGQTQLCHTVGGQLNPTWVELLMGFPPGWTDVA